MGYLEEILAGSRIYFANKSLGSRIKVRREVNDTVKKWFGNMPDG